jgi:hypothetical protein
MKYIKYSFEPLYENLKDAREFMKQRIASKLKKSVRELSSQEEELATAQPSFKEIEKLLASKGALGYMLPFVRFHFEHGAKIRGSQNNDRSLEALLDILTKDRTILGQLGNTLDWYAAQELVNGVDPFEAIWDQIRTIGRNREAKWIVNGLPVVPREQFRKLPASEQQELYNAAHTLMELGSEAISRIMNKIKAFKDWDIADIIEYIKNTLKGYSNAQLMKMMDELERLSPQAGMLYLGDGYLALSMRTEAAQKELCSIANWCINRGSFKTYAANAIQLNIFNFNIDPTDPLFLTGTTVGYDSAVTHSHDINDKSILSSAKSLSGHLTNLGYPDELITSVEEAFANEVIIKKIVYSLNLNATSTPKGILSKVNQATNSFPRVKDETSVSTILKIIEDVVESNIAKEDIIEVYQKSGILNQVSAMIFSKLATKLGREEIDQIVETSMKNFAMLEKISAKSPQLLNPTAINILGQKDLVLDQLSQF